MHQARGPGAYIVSSRSSMRTMIGCILLVLFPVVTSLGFAQDSQEEQTVEDWAPDFGENTDETVSEEIPDDEVYEYDKEKDHSDEMVQPVFSSEDIAATLDDTDPEIEEVVEEVEGDGDDTEVIEATLVESVVNDVEAEEIASEDPENINKDKVPGSSEKETKKNDTGQEIDNAVPKSQTPILNEVVDRDDRFYEADISVFSEQQEDIKVIYNNVNYVNLDIDGIVTKVDGQDGVDVKGEYFDEVSPGVFTEKEEIFEAVHDSVEYIDLDAESKVVQTVGSQYQRGNKTIVIKDRKDAEMGVVYSGEKYETEENAEESNRFNTLGTPYAIKTKIQKEAISRGY
jgi:hypothetical protein